MEFTNNNSKIKYIYIWNMFNVNNRSNRLCSGVFIVNFAEFKHVNARWNTLLS